MRGNRRAQRGVREWLQSYRVHGVVGVHASVAASFMERQRNHRAGHSARRGFVFLRIGVAACHARIEISFRCVSDMANGISHRERHNKQHDNQQPSHTPHESTRFELSCSRSHDVRLAREVSDKNRRVLAPFIGPLKTINVEPRPGLRVAREAVAKLAEIVRSMPSSTGKPSKTTSKV